MAIQIEIDVAEAELLAKHHVSLAYSMIGEPTQYPIVRDTADRIGDAMQELAKARAFLVEALKAEVETKSN